jgi:farnesyl-diphosphate farnesyltransferase
MNQREIMVRQVSRTFALSIEQLPDLLGEAISIAYLMFRISDGIEDHPEIPFARKIALLEQWAGILEGREKGFELARSVTDLDHDDPEVEVIQETPLILDWLSALPPAYQEPIIHHVHATTLGMARWQAHGPFVEDEAELDDYMHEVAGRVGYLVTELFALYSPRIEEQRDVLMPLSRECGLALQTVNVIRGIRKDYERGWVFIPRTYYERAGLNVDTILDPKMSTQALSVVGMLADKADRHLENGLEFVTKFPRSEHSIRLSLMWPFFFAARTLAISRNNPDVLTGEAKMTRNEIHRIVAETKLFGWSNRWLARYYRQLSEAPPVRTESTVARLSPEAATENL